MIRNVFRLCMLTCVLACVFTGCDDKDYYDPEKDPDYVDNSASTLDFSTSQTVKLDFNYDAPKGFVSTFDLYVKNPLNDDNTLRVDAEVIASGIHVAGYSQLTREIPAYVTELFLHSKSLFVPLLSYAKIENGIASFEIVDRTLSNTSETTRAGNAGDLWSRPISKYLKTINDYYSETAGGNYKYDLTPEGTDLKRDIPVEVLNSISTAFPEYVKLYDDEEGRKFIQDANLHVVRGGAKIYVSILHAGCSLKNSLSYFVYTGDKDFSELTKEETKQLELINLFQYADANTNVLRSSKLGLSSGKYIQLLYKNEKGEYVEEFPEGAKIGWKLHQGGFKAEDFSVVENSASIFSVSVWNDKKFGDGNHTGDTNYTVYFQTKDNEGNIFNCFGFEDIRYNTDEDFNDLIFHVLTDPADALVPPPSIIEKDVEKTETKKGTLAFEDNWPQKGDYDMNDVVVKYTSNVTYTHTVTTEDGTTIGSTDVTVKKVEDKFTFMHNGALFRNTFSYRVNLSSDNIKKVTLIAPNGNMIDYTNQITKDGSGFIVDVAENPLPSMTENATPVDYTVVIEFKDGTVLQDDFAPIAAPYNPFITPKGNFSGAEVHLPMYLPTNRVDMGLFGTEDDRSDKDKLWYVSGQNINFPFAIHLAGATNFNIPKETYDISTTYPNYLKWVESGMTDYKDWYK